MAVARVYQVSLAGTSATVAARVYRVSLAGTAASAGKARVYQVAMAGVGAEQVARVYQVSVGGTAAVVVNPISSQTVEPLSMVSIPLSLAGGGSPDSWQVVLTPAVPFTVAGDTLQFKAPGVRSPGTTVGVSVSAVVGDTASPPKTATVTVRPQILFSRVDNGPWVPVRTIVL